MKIGISMFVTDRMISPVALGRAIEERGLDSLFLPEHSHIPTSRKTTWPGSRPGENDPLPDYYSHMHDQMVSLSMIAAVTERLILGTAVTLIPQHDPIWLAKQTATLDALSGGRLMLGAGFGWNDEQGASHGVVYKERRDRTEECVEILRRLWRDEKAAYSGQHVQLEEAWAWPKPAQQGGPPLLIGGIGPRTYDAIGRYADGWLPITGRSSIVDLLQPIQAAFEKYDRDPASIRVVIAGATTDPAGLENLRNEGVEQALLTVWSEDNDEVMRTLDSFAKTKRNLD